MSVGSLDGVTGDPTRDSSEGEQPRAATMVGRMLQRWFSPNKLSQRPAIVFYCVWEFGAKVATLAFNLSNPLLVNSLGNLSFGEGTGAVIYSYLSVVSSILTAASFLTFTSVMEYETLKRKSMVRFAYACAFGLICFVFCFSPGSIYLASLLSVLCKVSQSIASLANDALLDAVTNENTPARSPSSSSVNAPSADPDSTLPPSPSESPSHQLVHQINARANVTGYLGMLTFLVLLAPVLAIAYIPGRLSLFWVQGIIPIVFIGLWYLFFLVQVDGNMPPRLGQGPPIPTLAEARSIVALERQGSANLQSTQSPYGNALPGSVSVSGSGSESPASGHSSPGSGSDYGSVGGEKQPLAPSGPTSCNPSAFPAQPPSRPCSDKSATDPIPSSSTALAHPSASPSPRRLSLLQLVCFGLQRGTAMQRSTVLSLKELPDLSKFITSWIFCSGAANTAYTVGAIIAYDINIGSQNPVYFIIAGVFVGIFSAIFGLVVMRQVLARGWMSPKYVLAANLVVVALVFVYILYVKTPGDFFAVALIAGSQIGCIGSFSKSIVSKLVPTKRQSRMFSLYQFSQESTGWIGPLVVASLQTAYGGGKRAFLVSVVEVCLVEIAIGLPLLLWVDMAAGEEARKMCDKNDEAEAQGSV